MNKFDGISLTVDMPQNILGMSRDHKTSSCSDILQKKKKNIRQSRNVTPGNIGATNDNSIVYVPGVKLPG